MLGAGVNPKIASERLGHATIAITMDFYQHVTSNMHHEAAVAIGGLLSPK
jgi:integrase